MKKLPDASLITNRTNIAYLSNFTGSSGFILIAKNKSYLFTDSRYIEKAKSTLKKGIKIINTTKVWKNPKELQKNWQKILKKHKIKILGIEEDNLTIAQFKKFKKISPKKLKFTNISGKNEEKREIKSKREIAFIKKSQRINEKVFIEIKKKIEQYSKKQPRSTKRSEVPDKQEVFAQAKTPLTEKNLAWKIKELGRKFGADDVSFDPIVAFGKHTSIPHHNPNNTKLKKDDIILIDMGMKYKGYCSDMTRMIFTAKPTEKQKKIYNLVLKAQKIGIEKIRAGITGKKADKFTRSIIEKAGYGKKYGHAGGHGIGLDIHEQPSLTETYKKTLKENSIITVEPGIYLEGKFGIRIEDILLITKNGNKNLTKITSGLRQ